MKTYRVSVNGCDDSTVFEMKMKDEEFEFLQRLVDKCKETSTHGCMPTMTVKEVKESK